MARIEDLMADSDSNRISRDMKLRVLKEMTVGGEFLPTLDVGEKISLLVLTDLQVSKDGRKLQPLRVKVLVDEQNQDRLLNFYQIDQNKDYKWFVPKNGAASVIKYVETINANLKNAVIVLQASEWKNAPATAARDSQGRAVIMNLITIYPYEDKNQATLEDIEKMFG